MLPTVILASNNPGKVKEFEAMAGKLPFVLKAQSEFNIPEAVETGLTFVENALIKARHAARLSRSPALADDSGLIVDALNGAPGIYSSRYAGEKATAQENLQKLLENLKEIPFEKRTARFYCVLVFLKTFDDPAPLIAEGVWEGKLLLNPQGKQGFGYDPIFYVPTHDCSAAELSLTDKMQLSHRGRAIQQLKIYL